MAFTHIASTTKAGGSGGGSTDAIDTTSADLLLALLGRYQAGASAGVTDSKGNTWTARTASSDTNAYARIFDSVPTSVGASHTATHSQAESYSALGFASFGGAHATPFGGEAGGAGSGSTIQPGSVTPSENNCLLVSVVCFDAAGTMSIDGGWTLGGQANYSSGVNLGVAWAYKIQSSAGAENPTWTHSATAGMATRIAWYKSADGGSDEDSPTLSSPTATVTGTTTATVGATTDEANGTLYTVVTTSDSQPSAAQIKAGQDHTGSAAVFADDQAISSTGAKTFSATGLSANTTYYAHFMHEDAATNQSDVESTSAFITRVLISVTDADWFFSPYNWFASGSTYKQSNTPGAYFKTKFTGTSCVLNVDVSPLTGASTGAGDYPRILYRVDSNACTSYQLTSSDTALTLATGLADETHTLEVVFVACAWDSEDRWNTPAMVLRVTGLQLDGGKDVATPDTYAGRMLVYGDSHSEGHEITAATVNVTNQDASLATPFILGRAFECEVGVVAYAGQGWTTQVGSNNNVPDFEDAWDFYHSGASRLSGGLLSPAPDYIVILHGDNDSEGVQEAVEATLPAMRTAAPDAEIMVCLPPSLDNEATITAGETAEGDDSTHLIDHGENLLTGPWINGTHLNQRGHARWAAILAKEIQETQSGGAGGSAFPVIGPGGLVF